MKTVREGVGKIRAATARLQSRRVGFLAIGLVIGILAAACSGTSTSPDPSTTPPVAGQPTGAPSPGQSTPTVQNRLPGPEEFGMTTQELVTSVEKVESLIAQCMRDAGFEYIAVDYDTVRKGMVADKSLPGVSDEDFIAQYGYGISTLYTGLPPQLSELATPAQIGLGEQNVRIFNNLSPADQAAYIRTLFGQNVDATLAVSLETEDFSRTGGCTRAAIEQVFTREQLSATYLNPLDTLIQQDPRMIAALKQFADCVREEGFNYNHPNEIEPDIKNRLDVITGGAPLEALSADARAALTELQGEERAIAAVATACEEDILEPVQVQIERELYGGQQP